MVRKKALAHSGIRNGNFEKVLLENFSNKSVFDLAMVKLVELYPKQRLVIGGLFLIFGSPFNCSACEPILPLVQLLAGSSLAGPALLTHSLFWLGVGVAIKCSMFALFEKRLHWKQAFVFMLVENVLSTIPGFLLAGFAGSGSGIILAWPLVLILGVIVQHRITKLFPNVKFPIPAAATLAFTALCIISYITFAMAQGALADQSLAHYWILKFFFVTIVACTGIVISAVLEECAIARLTRKSHGNLSFYKPVLRANYVTLGMILIVTALQLLPKRLKSPSFLAGWMDSILALLIAG